MRAACGLLALAAPAAAAAQVSPITGGVPVQVPVAVPTPTLPTPTLPTPTLPTASLPSSVSAGAAVPATAAGGPQPGVTVTRESKKAPACSRRSAKARGRGCTRRVASAAAETIVLRVEIAALPAVSCLGEGVTLSGYFLSKVHTTDFADGTYHISTANDFQGLSGVSVAGAKFTAGSENLYSFNSTRGSTETINSRARMIRTGDSVADDDFYLTFRLHITINALGVTTATVSDVSTDPCR